jgi:glycosyltransferase involved in cell wall biosynthesis
VHRIEPLRVPDDPPWLPKTAPWFAMALEMFDRGRVGLRRDPPTAVVATGPAFETFIAGYLLSRHFGAPLVLDYRDEWTLRPPFPWVAIREDDKRWEQRCLGHAARVLFVTRPFLELYVRAFPRLGRARCRVVANGWDPGDFGLAHARYPTLPALGATIRIGYFGFMADHQRPRHFLESVGRLIESRALVRTRVRIRIVGAVDGAPLDELNRFEFPSVFELFRWVDRRQAARMMMRCSALLIINDPRLSRARPTKLIEYLATGRPILVYGNGESEIRALVTQLGAGLSVPEGDDEALHRALEQFRDSPRSRWRTAARLRFLRQHTRELMARRLLDEVRAAERVAQRGTPAARRRAATSRGIPTE